MVCAVTRLLIPAARTASSRADRIGDRVLLGMHRPLLMSIPHARHMRRTGQIAVVAGGHQAVLRAPPVTITQPTCSRSQFERVDINTAVAMKYSSHEGRPGNFSAAAAIRSTALGSSWVI